MMSHSCPIFITITMVKVRLFRWWCCVWCIVLLSLRIIILRACQDPNKIASCGMIKNKNKMFYFFLTELNRIQPLSDGYIATAARS